MLSTPSIHVGLIEDDASCRRATARLLLAHGIHTVVYESAEAFLENRQQVRHDCLLLDIQLGGMSGLELQNQLVAEGSALPVVFFTAQEEPPATPPENSGKSARYLRKTEPIDVVLTAIRRAAGCDGTAALTPT